MTNRILSFHSVEWLEAEFVESDAFVASRFGRLPNQEVEGYHTFIIFENELVRLDTKNDPYPHAIEGEQVKVPVKKGLWGFRYFVFNDGSINYNKGVK